ncbi:DUF2309 domain-containing protein [Roseiconus nitratireducens]|uniref:Probable inorganic carbon transporter subunit DabA n=1 Tax=Roseiconus nitratireducens TaxID=2605748 RepID=A0A5M6DI86_9BACT|nr:DUF2309 domain-containing protein [Roseiconus nitratireducens]KAA5546086.1 DUF2309 domain-containing protein [Roseiconus nitratireducens]
MHDASVVIPANESADSRLGTSIQPESLARAIEHAIEYLPTQGPISIFVHHNTLHSFEHLPFDQAVIEGGRRYGCEPYLSESRYRDELHRGRISIDDLRQVLMDDLGDHADDLVASFGTRYTLRLAMLQVTIDAVPDAELRWLIAETDLLRKFREEVSPQRREQMITQTRNWVARHVAGSARSADSTAASSLPESVLGVMSDFGSGDIQHWSERRWEELTLRLLWQACRDGIQQAQVPSPTASTPLTLHQKISRVTGEDTARVVNDVLIRFVGVFLDQGFADWELPDRDLGFATSFAKLYLEKLVVTPAWMEGIKRELRAIVEGPFDPMLSIADSLARMGIEFDEFDEEICEAALALRGWAGMIWQMETATPFLPKPIPDGSFFEYLAIRLLLQRYAISDVGRRHFGTSDLAQIRSRVDSATEARHQPSIDERTHAIFQVAQIGGWTPQQLFDMTSHQWTCLVNEFQSFSSLERRRILHTAYERHYMVQTLDALAVHARRRRELPRSPETKPSFLAVFCIDDREESFRRHLEEVDPRCETASAAGFFAVAMYYRGADQAHYRPLCPAIIQPNHYVQEEPLFSTIEASKRRANRRRQLGQMKHRVHANSRSLIGGMFTAVFGALATIPMVTRILAPRLTAKMRESLGTFMRPPATELHLEREAEEPGSDPESLGYSLDEMAAIVVRILQDIGHVKNLPRIVVFFGHGSSSLNNPHESAYNCGACSGGRGGPNARAFAMMANDPRVRELVAKRGIELPSEVRFVGAFHNTCDDSVEYYDLDLLPRSHRGLFREIEKSVDQTRARDAHERARRFESAPLDMTPREALEHVEERSQDLSQARPEYNHATNALVTVGRRHWTRGLFMDRRVFLTEYDPAVDDEDVNVLTRILSAAIPVCAGISLEYYFSSIDVEGYGCGSKLPHNVASMVGVMTGAASDLRPGLSQQMIEIHEPMRILFVIETTPEKMARIIEKNEGIARLVEGHWVSVALIDPETSSIMRYVDRQFEPYTPSSNDLPQVESSIDWYRGTRTNLGFASIVDRAPPAG